MFAEIQILICLTHINSVNVQHNPIGFVFTPIGHYFYSHFIYVGLMYRVLVNLPKVTIKLQELGIAPRQSGSRVVAFNHS